MMSISRNVNAESGGMGYRIDFLISMAHLMSTLAEQIIYNNYLVHSIIRYNL